MGSGAVIYVPSLVQAFEFNKGGYTDTHRQQRDLISLLYFFFQNKESRLKTGCHRGIALDSLSRCPGFESRLGHPLSWLRFFMGFLQANAGILLRLHHCRFLLILSYPSVILPFGAVFKNTQWNSVSVFMILCTILPLHIKVYCYITRYGRAIAEAVSRRLPTAAPRVRSQVMWNLWWTK
jgi:hypothetical protein